MNTTLRNGDSRELIKEVGDNSIDLILTDPPYNIGECSTGNILFKGRKHINCDIADWDNGQFRPEDYVNEFKRVLKPDGNIFIFANFNQMGTWQKLLDEIFDRTNFAVWHKTNPAPQVRKVSFLSSCELIVTAWNNGHKWNFTTQNDMHNFFETPLCMGSERLKEPVHPTQKPVSILKKLIQISSDAGDTVFDPFMGVGSTGVAATALDRSFVGFELDSDFFNAAKKRIDGELEQRKVEQMQLKFTDDVFEDTQNLLKPKQMLFELD